MATRRERVVLELEDNFSTGMAKVAATTALAKKELRDLDGTAVRTGRSLSGDATRGVTKLGASSDRTGSQIDRLSGRMRIFADLAATLGPGLVPIGAVGIPAVAGLAAQFGAAALAGGTLMAASQGVGDALEAVNEAALLPTTENLEKARLAMEQIGPAARQFTTAFQEFRPVLTDIRDAAAAGWFPGLTTALDDLARVGPKVSDIFYEIGRAGGDLAAAGAESLAGPRWAEFLTFIENNVPQAVTELGETVGNLTHGLAEMWMAFDPLNDDFAGWLLNASAAFDDWAQGLAQTQDFRDFVDYIRSNGPRVADALVSVGRAVLDIVEAAAPLGGPVLAAIEAFANAVSLIMDSDLGTPIMAGVAALALFNRAQQVMGRVSSTAWAANIRGANGYVASMSTVRTTALRAGAGIAALAVASSGVADSMGASNTVLMGMAGAMVGPWGAAAGATAGLLLDIEARSDAAAEAMGRFNDALQTGDTSAAQDEIEGMRDRLASLQGTDMASISFSSLGNLFSGTSVEDEIEALTGDIRRAEDALGSLGDAQAQAANQAGLRRYYELETQAIQENINAMRAKRDEALRGFSAETNYAQSLLDAKAALKENGKTLDTTTQKGLDNRRALEQMASGWNELTRSTNTTQAEYRSARADLIRMATQMGASKQEARELARELLDIPGRVNTEIGVDAETALAHIRAVERELDSIQDEDVYITLHTRRPNAGGMGPQIGAADGATVPGQRYPYGDKVHAFLAPGEEVISNRYGQADRHRQLLKAINANAMADGGTVKTALAPSINVAGANVSVGAPSVRVFIDGSEVRSIVRSEQSRANDFDRWMSRD